MSRSAGDWRESSEGTLPPWERDFANEKADSKAERMMPTLMAPTMAALAVKESVMRCAAVGPVARTCEDGMRRLLNLMCGPEVAVWPGVMGWRRTR